MSVNQVCSGENDVFSTSRRRGEDEARVSRRLVPGGPETFQINS